jgi:hypothetical protein
MAMLGGLIFDAAEARAPALAGVARSLCGLFGVPRAARHARTVEPLD